MSCDELEFQKIHEAFRQKIHRYLTHLVGEHETIATRLVISLPTVKRHISNIHAKLGVKGRTQAISLGREPRLV